MGNESFTSLLGLVVVPRGFVVRSICITNAAFLCKLTWDILISDSPSSLLRQHYFHEDGRPRNFRCQSSIWARIHQHALHVNMVHFGLLVGILRLSSGLIIGWVTIWLIGWVF